MMKVIYTNSAEEELEKFQKEQQEQLEKIISDKKLVYGDDILEITATDIKEAKNNLKISTVYTRRNNRIYLISRLYVTFGLSITLTGFLYPLLKEMLLVHREQAVMLMMGIIMTVIGIIGLIVSKGKR